MLAEAGGVSVAFGGQARRREDDVALLRELADAREDGVADPAPERVVVGAAVGEECTHAVDQEVPPGARIGRRAGALGVV